MADANHDNDGESEHRAGPIGQMLSAIGLGRKPVAHYVRFH